LFLKYILSYYALKSIPLVDISAFGSVGVLETTPVAKYCTTFNVKCIREVK